MQIRIDSPPMRFGHDVYLFDHVPDEGTVIYNIDGSRREVVAPGDEPEPSFHCDNQALAALVKAGSEVVPPSRSMERHLDDAMFVRDRLLALVEHGVKGDAS
jgi:hypothetical protein